MIWIRNDEEEEEYETESEKNEDLIMKEKVHHLIYPFYDSININNKCQKIVEEAENYSAKQFDVAISLLEGKNDFPININLGKVYLKKSFDKKHLESIIYNVQMIIIQRNFQLAQKIISENSNIHDVRFKILMGCIFKKSKVIFWRRSKIKWSRKYVSICKTFICRTRNNKER